MEIPCRVCGAATAGHLRLPEVDLRRCPSCGHKQSLLRDGVAREAYSREYFQRAHQNWFAHPNLPLFARICAIFRDLGVGESPRMIDIGCGNGDFLRHARRALPGARLVGLDLAAVGEPEGYDFVQADFRSYQPDAPFDAAVSLAFIEHLEDVEEFAESVSRCLRPGGLVAVMTVDSESFLNRTAEGLHGLGLRSPAERIYEKHHSNHFTRASLRTLLARRGLRTERQFGHNFPLGAIDLPEQLPPPTRTLFKAGVGAVFAAAPPLRPFLQTVVCRKGDA